MAHKLCLTVALATVIASVSVAETIQFESAKPIWPEGRTEEKNLFVGFRAVFDKPENDAAVLRITGSTLYRVYLNGEFIGHGPARGPHGYYRVDEWDLGRKLRAGKNLAAIEVAGYNANSYYLLDQPAFVQAEVISDRRVLASTAGKGAPFEAAILEERSQKVQRYSFQRPFIEYYRLRPDYGLWRADVSAPFTKTTCAETPSKNLLPRRIPYPRFSLRPPLKYVSKGGLETGRTVEKLWKDRSLVNIGPKLGGYVQDDLDSIVSDELQQIGNTEVQEIGRELTGQLTLNTSVKEFHILDFGTNLTGFLGAQIECEQPTRLFFVFDEILSNGDVDFKRMGCVNAVGYELEPGSYMLESFEPYTFRYMKNPYTRRLRAD